MFTDVILDMLGWIFECITGLTADGSGFTVGLPDFNNGLYTWSITILHNVAMPVAMVILSLFMMLEMYHAALKAQNSGSSIPAEIIFKILIRMALAKLAIDSIELIMLAIFSISTYLTEQIAGLVTSGTAGTFDLETLKPSVQALDFGSQVVTMIVALIVYLITMIASLYAQVLVVTRFIQIYLYLAVSPIPTATLLDDQHSAIGKGFLKSFGAVCLQGTLLYLVMTFFPVIMVNAIQITDNVTSALWSVAGYSFVLLFALSGTGKWASKITGDA